jgi:hypothetical protein
MGPLLLQLPSAFSAEVSNFAQTPNFEVIYKIIRGQPARGGTVEGDASPARSEP